MRRAFAPGRVNLIGEHTDYTGGFVLPMAVHLGTTVEVSPGGDRVRLRSDDQVEPVDLPLDATDPVAVEPPWGRYVAGVVAELRPRSGADGSVATTLPIGAGLSSSAALEVAVALALGFEGSTVDLARLCRRAEQRASGVPCGIMDQLAAAAGVAGHALLIDCTTEQFVPVPVPEGVDVVAVDSGERRSLAGSAYAERRSACEQAEAVVGPLRFATVEDLGGIGDPVVRRRARHVVTENARVMAFVDALRAGERRALGELMAGSHASLRDDFDVSTPVLDDLVVRLRATPGVIGARLTGAGFGGCVVALCERGARIDGWRLRAVDGARVEELGA
jgi:galactokinase